MAPHKRKTKPAAQATQPEAAPLSAEGKAYMSRPNATVKLLVDAATRVVQHAGLRYRVQAVTAHDLLSYTSRYLVSLPVDPETAIRAASGDGDARKTLKAAMRPEAVAEDWKIMEAVVCAGVKGMKADDAAEWDPVELVSDERKEDPDANPARLWIGRLPPGAVQVVSSEVFALSGNDGRAADRLAYFRGATGDRVAG